MSDEQQAPQKVEVRNMAGQVLSVGDRVGGTSSGRYQETIVGELIAFGFKGSKAKVMVDISSRRANGLGTEPGDTKWIDTDRLFLVNREVKAVLFINRSDSRCGNCGQNTLPTAKRHAWVSGYGDRKRGCGAKFVVTSSDYGRGVVSDDDLRRIRPDLPVAQDRAASRSEDFFTAKEGGNES